MEFDIEKCVMLIVKKSKRETTQGIELQKKSTKKLREKENYK